METPDTLGRPLRSLRLSVTDRCNLRCRYCMPEPEYVWLPREDVLRFEEIGVLARAFVDLGVDRLRLTGGEPLLRRDLPALVGILADIPGLRDLALTTNGVLLAEQADALFEAGLHRVTVSLDTLKADRFTALTRRNDLPRVQAGIDALSRRGRRDLKLDVVVMRGWNDDELCDLVEYGKEKGAEVRFIEYMDVGGATRWSMAEVVSRREILEVLGRRYGRVTPRAEGGSAPAERFELQDGTTFGVIASVTAPFCRRCDRSRLTADGLWYLCLYAAQGVDLRGALRGGASAEELRQQIASVWRGRSDRGAEERIRLDRTRPSLPVQALRHDPHLEMHTRGG
jgi:GTP 3',8-cyclase